MTAKPSIFKTVFLSILIGGMFASQVAQSETIKFLKDDYIKVSIETKNAKYAAFQYDYDGVAKEKKIQLNQFEETKIVISSLKRINDVQIPDVKLETKFNLSKVEGLFSLNLTSPSSDHSFFDGDDTRVDTYIKYFSPYSNVGSDLSVDVPSSVLFNLPNAKFELIRNGTPAKINLFGSDLVIDSDSPLTIQFVMVPNELGLDSPKGDETTGGNDTGGEGTGTDGSGGETGNQDNGGNTNAGDTNGGDIGNENNNSEVGSSGCQLAPNAPFSFSLLAMGFSSLGSLIWMRRRSK